MKIQSKIGPISGSSGSEVDLRSEKSGALVVSQGHGKYQELVLTGNSYIGANLGGTPVTTQVGLSATTPALTLYNPVGSGVNLVMISCTIDITTSPAGASGFMLAYNLKGAGAPTALTLANVTNAILDNGKLPIGQCYRIATLAAVPLAFRFIGGTSGASAISGIELIDNIDGEFIIPPGVAVSLQATAAAACLASFSWEEISIL